MNSERQRLEGKLPAAGKNGKLLFHGYSIFIWEAGMFGNFVSEFLFWKIPVMIVQRCECTKCHWAVHLKMASCMYAYFTNNKILRKHILQIICKESNNLMFFHGDKWLNHDIHEQYSMYNRNSGEWKDPEDLLWENNRSEYTVHFYSHKDRLEKDF